MEYRILCAYDLDGVFAGYAIEKVGTKHLESVNLWTEDEKDDLRAAVQRLNEESIIKANWPRVDDPAVQMLLADETWEPLNLQPTQVVDENASDIVYQRAILLDADGFPVINEATGEFELGDEYINDIDYENSRLVYKVEMLPDPREVQGRIFKAQEVIARRRVGATV